jgi:hypothetical protein
MEIPQRVRSRVIQIRFFDALVRRPIQQLGVSTTGVPVIAGMAASTDALAMIDRPIMTTPIIFVIFLL